MKAVFLLLAVGVSVTLAKDVHDFGNYILVTAEKSFQDAESFCEGKESKLVSLHRKGTESIIQRLFKQIGAAESNIFWLGLRKPAGADTKYSWIDGSSDDYSNWAEGAPKASASEGCVAHKDSSWVVLGCDEKHPFVCERKH
ncbi:hypothetical protein QR680_014402 [Steinernema hermaphroditum]|uniref:C-type lectin domain-containing protein n=1 Tax=Steinernema hermaphroditum TaxID=289476 RepID=A0AA39M454_9BILA|nr:hypothetical protein QR680_014402 [Steinernema hermaphroditum]